MKKMLLTIGFAIIAIVGAVTGIAEKGECLLPAVAQSATESIGERR